MKTAAPVIAGRPSALTQPDHHFRRNNNINAMALTHPIFARNPGMTGAAPTMRISEIKIGERFRKEMGDLDEFARSIAEVGLLHEVVVTPDGDLIAGERRILTWVKDRMGMGDWLRGKTEHCIMAVRGKPVVEQTGQSTVLDAPMRGHSQKPDEFYALVEKLCPAPRYAELWARSQREGWDGHGDEYPGRHEPGRPRPDDLVSVIAQLPRVAAEVEAGCEIPGNEASAGDEAAG
jgi:MT-A70